MFTGCVSDEAYEQKYNELSSKIDLLSNKVDDSSQCSVKLEELQKLNNENSLSDQSKLDKLNKEISNVSNKNDRLIEEISEIKESIAKKKKDTTTPQSKEVVYDMSNSSKKTPEGKLIVGASEWAVLEDYNIALLGRIDTGATTSGLFAKNIEIFERDGKKWVRFDLPDREGNYHKIEGKYSRSTIIVQSSQESKSDQQERHVVKLKIRLGDVVKTSEFTLSDRSGMSFALLLGREFLKDDVVVDIGKDKNFGKPKADIYIDRWVYKELIE